MITTYIFSKYQEARFKNRLWCRYEEHKVILEKKDELIKQLDEDNTANFDKALRLSDKIIELEKELKIYKGVARG